MSREDGHLWMLRPKNWRTFQHYNKRRPPWIKLHRSLLDNCEFQCLHVASKALAPCLWLLASESENGEIKQEPRQIAFRLRMSEKDFKEAIKPLIKENFFECSDEMLAWCKHDDSNMLPPETETETEKTETEEEGRGARINSRHTTKGINGHDKSIRGQRLDPSWEPSSEDRQFCISIGLDPSEVADKFRDYWIAKPGAAGSKLDWAATWRNWCRRDATEKGSRALRTGGGRSEPPSIIAAFARAAAKANES